MQSQRDKTEEHRIAEQIINKNPQYYYEKFLTIGIHFQNGLKDNPVSICFKNAMKVMQKKSLKMKHKFSFSIKKEHQGTDIPVRKKMSLNELH